MYPQEGAVRIRWLTFKTCHLRVRISAVSVCVTWKGELLYLCFCSVKQHLLLHQCIDSRFRDIIRVVRDVENSKDFHHCPPPPFPQTGLRDDISRRDKG
ncbi:hypothetical protein CHS0354_002206 [Potamilus streckersoni]|uniref:Uncharacterized protein n=1 Tax=Potamilus streckersoni TaxID=2493646 RepID=A0AAE0RS91_9BIVA|nr:hypothetical protein CHS0354_002206 [Potamilus streckersoni]